MKNPIIAALDVPEASAALTLAEEVASAVGAFKIGKELFVAGETCEYMYFIASGTLSYTKEGRLMKSCNLS